MLGLMEAEYAIAAAPEPEDDLFEMANLYPKNTGLPMTIWISQKGGANHDVRVKVSPSHGAKMDIHNAAVVSVRPRVEVLHGNLQAKDLEAVRRWVVLNAQAIIDYWNGEIDTLDLGQRLQRL